LVIFVLPKCKYIQQIKHKNTGSHTACMVQTRYAYGLRFEKHEGKGALGRHVMVM